MDPSHLTCPVLSRLAAADLSGFLSLSIRLIFSDIVVFKFSPIFFGLGSKDFFPNCRTYFRCQAKRIEVSLFTHSAQRFFCRVSIACCSDGDVLSCTNIVAMFLKVRKFVWTLFYATRITNARGRRNARACAWRRRVRTYNDPVSQEIWSPGNIITAFIPVIARKFYRWA